MRFAAHHLVQLLQIKECSVKNKLILISMLTAFPAALFADTKETEILAKVTEDYAKCADVALGNFTSDEKSQQAIRVFFKAMLSNVEMIVAIESKSENESLNFFLDVMGKDVYTGFLLKGLSELDESYKISKQQLSVQFNHDWRLVNENLWAKQGCNAIYVGLQK
jgi:hypothetical protein